MHVLMSVFYGTLPTQHTHRHTFILCTQCSSHVSMKCRYFHHPFTIYVCNLIITISRTTIDIIPSIPFKLRVLLLAFFRVSRYAPHFGCVCSVYILNWRGYNKIAKITSYFSSSASLRKCSEKPVRQSVHMLVSS